MPCSRAVSVDRTEIRRSRLRSHPVVVATPLADRILSFDDTTGVLRAESGYSLQSLYHDFLPRGWFTPVTPGTQFVTLGGMVAADIHGKNHHVDGTIGRHVRAIRLRVASGDIVECSRTQEPDLFRATIGGMGLTGHMLEIELQLSRVPSPWIWGEMLRVAHIDEYLDALKASASRMAVHHGVDRLPVTRSIDGTRCLAARAMGH